MRPVLIVAFGLLVGDTACAEGASPAEPLCHEVAASGASSMDPHRDSRESRRTVVTGRPDSSIVVNQECVGAAAPGPAATAMAAIMEAPATAPVPTSETKKTEAASGWVLGVQIFRLLILLALVVPVTLLVRHAIRFADTATAQVVKDRGIRYTSHWGGFGGADSGWTLGPAAVDLLVAAVLAVGAAVLGAVIVQALDAGSVPAETTAKPAAKAAP